MSEPSEHDCCIPFTPTPEQDKVIKASAESRLLVDAAAGTGKTAVACARVAHLIQNCGVEPTNLWLISFTRPAVAEIRKRIFDYVGGAAYSIKIATLDQQAFQIVQGFQSSKEQRIFESYELTIEKAIELLVNARPEVREAIGFLEHVIVDEAQDVVGRRAELLLNVVNLLGKSCGVSIFFDPAQAIYQFSEPPQQRFTLPEVLRNSKTLKFTESRLTKVHRTSSAKLLSIFEQTRVTVLSAKLPGESKFSKVKEDIKTFADSELGKEFLQGVEASEDLLVLFRSRGEVLKASSLLSGAETKHRVRISGYPSCVHPWVALLFWDYCERQITRSTFEGLVRKRMSSALASGHSEVIWALLKRVAQESKDLVNIHQLRRVLSRPRPPIDFTSPDVGSTGPIIGTIHASKGREADDVHLHFNDDDDRECSSLDEEASVLFVGATRARKSLKIGNGFKWMRTLKPSGRAFHVDYAKSHPASVEIGMNGDVDPLGQASQSLYKNAEEAIASQTVLSQLSGSVFKLSAQTDREKDFRYRLIYNETVVGHLSDVVNKELFFVGRKVNSKTKLRPSPNIYDVWSVGVRSIVLAPENTGLQSLLPPFNESGIMLAPVPCAFPTVRFYSYGGKRK
ncbi:MAG TPA: UvrD-helicase domain-containing protein [Clostridia bacterium]|nr:UvrD-helicase domain-containing protein [Clostridia bacterium]